MSSQRDAESWSPMTHTLVEVYAHVLAHTLNPPPIRSLNTLYRNRLQKLALKGDESERKKASRCPVNECVPRRPVKAQERFIETEQRSSPPLPPKSKGQGPTSKPSFAILKAN